MDHSLTTLALTTLDPIEPDWFRVALLTIDMQNDFALAEGSGFVTGTDEILPALADLIHAFRKSELPIFHAVRLYLEDGSNAERCRQRLLQSGVSLARPGTSGARVVDMIHSSTAPDESSALLAGEYVPLNSSEWLFYKSRWSAFYGTGLEERLLGLDVDTLVVAGCNFPNCPALLCSMPPNETSEWCWCPTPCLDFPNLASGGALGPELRRLP